MSDLKTCSKCKIEKDIKEFSKDCTAKDGLQYHCKYCVKQHYRKNKEKKKQYRENNKEKILLKDRQYYKNNKQKLLLQKKQFRVNNREKMIAKDRAYYQKNKESLLSKNLQYRKNKYKTDTNYKLTEILRSRLRSAIKNNRKSVSAIKDLGCSINFLKGYLEVQFQEGMTWKNHGEWHIDHIRPLSSFDLTDKEQLLKAAHFSNLQPLWAIDNLSKGAKYYE